MITPFRSPASLDATAQADPDLVLTLCSQNQSTIVTEDGFLIGTSRQCDLTIIDEMLRPLHAVIHMQQGSVWIESAVEEADLRINDRPCRRSTLRQGDRLGIGSAEFTIQLGVSTNHLSRLEQVTIAEDLTLLTAEELCDRIVAERTMVEEFTHGQHAGWMALLEAIEAAQEEPGIVSLPTESVDIQTEYGTLLSQIRELNETIESRTRDLTEQEAHVMESASMLEESQQQVVQRIDQILDQLPDSDSSNEFRASA